MPLSAMIGSPGGATPSIVALADARTPRVLPDLKSMSQPKPDQSVMWWPGGFSGSESSPGVDVHRVMERLPGG